MARKRGDVVAETGAGPVPGGAEPADDVGADLGPEAEEELSP